MNSVERQGAAMKSSKNIRQIRLQIERAENALREAMASAYLRSASRARLEFGIPASKVTASMMEQLAHNDPEVISVRSTLLDLKQDLIDQENLEAERLQESSGEVSQRILSALEIPYIHLGDAESEEAEAGNALDIYQAVSGEVRVIAESVKTITRAIADRDSQWNKAFWEDDVLEGATIYKTDLTDYAEIVRSILRFCADKTTQTELRSMISYINSLRDDCKSLIDLAKIQSRGF